MSHENVRYSLRRIPRGCIEQVQFLEFLASMEGVALVDMRGMWVCSLEGSGEFLVASVRRLIDEGWLPELSTKTCWINVMPIKVNVHAWKVRYRGEPGLMTASKMVLHNWQRGKIPFFVSPPKQEDASTEPEEDNLLEKDDSAVANDKEATAKSIIKSIVSSQLQKHVSVQEDLFSAKKLKGDASEEES
ncbi:hypothetical protein Tco_0357351 [Tanacetum coccineum]